MDSRQLLLITFVGTGLILSILAIPMIMGLIGPNPFYGFRTRKSMSNREVWYEINAYSGWWLLADGLIVALVAAVVYAAFPGFDKDIYSSVMGIVVIVLLAVTMVVSLNRLKTL